MIYEENSSGAKMVKTTKWQFPSLRIGGKFYTLDRSKEMFSHIYYVYSLGDSNFGLSQAELDYNYRLTQVNNERLYEIEDLKVENGRLKDALLDANNQLTELKDSTWAYIKYRFK